ncbi:MAG: OmpA family protein [Myxococcota bacterium]
MSITKGAVRRASFCVLYAMCAATWGVPAMAQDSAAVDLQLFNPAVGPNAIYATEGARVLPSLKFNTALMLNYASEPLVEAIPGQEDGEELVTPIVDQQLALHVLAGIGVADLAQIDVAFPVYIVNDGALNGEDFGGATIGDLAIRGKGEFLRLEDGPLPIGVGGLVELTFPTGDDEEFVGEQGLTATPKLLVDATYGSALFVVNAGARIRQSDRIRDIEVGPEFVYGAGTEVAFLDGLLAIAGELNGRSGFTPNTSPLEGVLGIKLRTPGGVTVSSGAGGGLAAGAGSTEFRAFIGVGFDSSKFAGIEPGPDPTADSDVDGVPDLSDGCVAEPEDLDGFEDDDGCPDLDNDGDGIPDATDTCPDEAGAAGLEGCPVRDADGDGVADSDDGCPDEAEDVDGYKDEDGCPDLDNDGDGIPDAEDAAPDAAEDMDGFEDEDGKPELDNDGDGIADTEDKCVNEAETYNGNDDEDGCPDGKETVVITETEIRILEKVFFDGGKATISAKSFGLLNTVATVLKQNPRITGLRIEGHTDDRGKDESNMKLSTERAEAVRKYLVEKDIAPERLEAKGFGETKPRCADIPELTKTRRLERKNRRQIKECRALNRRVEFRIVSIDGEVMEATESATIVEQEVVEEPIEGSEEPETSGEAPKIEAEETPSP